MRNMLIKEYWQYLSCHKFLQYASFDFFLSTVLKMKEINYDCACLLVDISFTLLYCDLERKLQEGNYLVFKQNHSELFQSLMAIKFLVVSIIILKNFDCIHHTAPVSLGNKILSRELRGPELND